MRSQVSAKLPPGARPRPVSPLRGGISRKLAAYVATKRVHARNQRPLVSFTFDDVPDNAFTHGARVLEENGVRGTFYITGGLAGTQQDEWRLAKPEDIAAAHRRGHEIGCHTYSHPVVQWLDADGFTAELDSNKAFLASLGIAAESFCYPYGIASLSRKLQAQRRYSSCRGTKPGINSGTIDLGMLRATPIDHTSTEAAIERTIDETVRRNGWLVMFTHDVSPTPTWIGATPQLLDAAVKAALARGCEVVTVRDALTRIGAPPAR